MQNLGLGIGGTFRAIDERQVVPEIVLLSLLCFAMGKSVLLKRRVMRLRLRD